MLLCDLYIERIESFPHGLFSLILCNTLTNLERFRQRNSTVRGIVVGFYRSLLLFIVGNLQC